MASGFKTGVLLVNLGTPDGPDTASVRRYLREFLMDGRVIDIPAPVRWMLVNLIIAPFRAPKSAEAYGAIWTPEGSPLLVQGHALRDGVASRFADRDVPVVLAMRYGNPSIESGMKTLRAAGCDHVVVVPLYPQYASSTTGTVVEVVYEYAAKLWNTPFITVVPPFYDHPGFLDAFAGIGRPVLDEFQADHVLFSFHGLPVRHLERGDPSGVWCHKTDSCCERAAAGEGGEGGQACYRAHCLVTARGIAERLGLSDEAWTMTFQSRLGRAEWIGPSTQDVAPELARKGTKRLAVYCPAFVSDNLETLEEIGIQLTEDFQAHGGEALQLVPSLNAEPAWVDVVVSLVEDAIVPRRRLPVLAAAE